MTTYTKTFNYQKNPNAEIEARQVIILNEDENDFSGFDTKYLTEEQVALINEEFKDREVTADFSSNKKREDDGRLLTERELAIKECMKAWRRFKVEKVIADDLQEEI